MKIRPLQTDSNMNNDTMFNLIKKEGNRRPAI